METRITEISGAEYPIIQGNMAQVAEHNLAAAVSEAGGFGLIGGANALREVVRDEIHKVRELTDKPFGVDVMLLNPRADDVVRVVVGEGIKVITTGAEGSKKHMEMWETVGVKAIPVIAGVALTRHMEKYGANAVVAEGVGPGGYIGEQTIMTLIPQVAGTISTPVITVGGIRDGRGTTTTLMLGVEAIQMGTRFVVAKEFIVHENYKQCIIKAKDIDSTVTGRSHGHPVRGLGNRVTRKYTKLEQEGRSFEELECLIPGALCRAVMEGDIDGGTTIVEQIAGVISKEQTCKEMIEEIMARTGELMHWNQGPETQAPDWMETNRIQDKEITSVSKVVSILPGQGTQACGMGKDSYEQTETGKRIFDKAIQLMGFSMSQLCFGENDRLDIMEYIQVAMIVTSIAMMRVLGENGIKPDVVAGLSLGERCALATVRVMSDEDTIRTVRQRGVLIQETVPMGEGAMAAILALDAVATEEMTGAIEGAWIASYNCPGQIIIPGEKVAVEEVYEKLRVAGIRRAVTLNVSGLPHFGMLTAVGEKLGQALSRVELHEPWIPYVASVTARYVKSAAEVKELLTRQVSSSVRWQQSVEATAGDGVSIFIGIGSGKILVGFMRRVSRDVKTLSVEELEDIGKAAEALKS